MTSNDGLSGEGKWLLEPMTRIANDLNTQSDWTWAHSGRVARYAIAFARRLGLDEQEILTLQCAALLHDVGKTIVPAALLNKITKLTMDEWFTITKHPMASAQILKNQSIAVQVAGIACSHHEWYDGSGYPMGLRGDAIPLGARILSIADACDAMSSDRPYRKALAPEEILEQITRGAGKQFDPVLLHRLALHLMEDLSLESSDNTVRVVSDDAKLAQQIWFALYPHGWDIELEDPDSSDVSHQTEKADQTGVATSLTITVRDGIITTEGVAQGGEPTVDQVIWIHPPKGMPVRLDKPLDLGSLLQEIHRIEEPYKVHSSIRVLLADPFQLFRQALKQYISEHEDMTVVAAVESATAFRRARNELKYDVAVVASDLLVGTYSTEPLKPGDIHLSEDESQGKSTGDPPTIVLVSDDDMQDYAAASVMRHSALPDLTAHIYRGASAETLVEIIRKLARASAAITTEQQGDEGG